VDTEGEVGRGEYCERFNEDVGDGLVFGEVGIELVAEVHRGMKEPSSQPAIARAPCRNHAKQGAVSDSDGKYKLHWIEGRYSARFR